MLKKEVGTSAGYVWNLLSAKGKLSLSEICKYIDCNNDFISLVIGWLLREDKIQCEEYNGTLFVELKQAPTEMYYG